MADTFRDVAHKIFEYKQPDEILKGFESRHINLGVTNDGQTSLGLLTFPDLDGSSIFIPRILNEKEDFLVEPMKRAGAIITESTLSSYESGLIAYCSEELKWPILPSVHALSTKLDINRFKLPASDSPQSKLVIVQGDANAGKSTFIATLKLWHPETKIGSLDTFSGKTPQLYVDYSLKNNLNSRSNESEILKSINAFRMAQSLTPKISGLIQAQPFSVYLDNFIAENLSGDTRPSEFVMEGIGTKTSGIMSGNVYHLATCAGEYSYDLVRGASLKDDVRNFRGNVLGWARTEGSYIQKEFLRLVKK
jgi:hypothetical protein